MKLKTKVRCFIHNKAKMQNAVCWNNREYFAFLPSVKKGVRGNSFPRKIACGGTTTVDRPHAILLNRDHLNQNEPNPQNHQNKISKQKDILKWSIKDKTDSKKSDHFRSDFYIDYGKIITTCLRQQS